MDEKQRRDLQQGWQEMMQGPEWVAFAHLTFHEAVRCPLKAQKILKSYLRRVGRESGPVTWFHALELKNGRLHCHVLIAGLRDESLPLLRREWRGDKLVEPFRKSDQDRAFEYVTKVAHLDSTWLDFGGPWYRENRGQADRPLGGGAERKPILHSPAARPESGPGFCSYYLRTRRDHRLVRHEGDWAIYEAVHRRNGALNYELRRIIRRGGESTGTTKDLGADWGTNAWTYCTLETACARLEEMVLADRQASVSPAASPDPASPPRPARLREPKTRIQVEKSVRWTGSASGR